MGDLVNKMKIDSLNGFWTISTTLRCSSIILCRLQNVTWSSSSSFWIAKFLGSGCLMLLSSMFDAGEEACWSTVPLIVWNAIASKGQDKIASRLEVLHSKFWSNPNCCWFHDFTSRSLLFDAPSWQSLDGHYLSPLEHAFSSFAKLMNFQCKDA